MATQIEADRDAPRPAVHSTLAAHDTASGVEVIRRTAAILGLVPVFVSVEPLVAELFDGGTLVVTWVRP